MFAGSDGVEKTLYYFSTYLLQSGARASGFFEILRNPCAAQQPGQERILQSSTPATSHVVRDFILNNSAAVIRGPLRNSAGVLQSEEVVPLPVRTLLPARSRNSRGGICESSCRAVPRRPADGFSGIRLSLARPRDSNLLLSVRLPGRGPGRPGDGFFDLHVAASYGGCARLAHRQRCAQQSQQQRGFGFFWFRCSALPAIASVNQAIQHSPKMRAARRWCAVPTTDWVKVVGGQTFALPTPHLDFLVALGARD